MISIVIPALNEALNLPLLLSDIEQAITHCQPSSIEVIVVDGGSSDNTQALAEASAIARFIRAERGRARQCLAGVQASSGDLLWFVHADSRLSSDCLQALLALAETSRAKALSPSEDPNPIWGRFDIGFNVAQYRFLVLAWFINQRSRWSGIATGDQGIFVSRSLLQQVGGLADIPLMEDVALSQSLKEIQKPYCLSATLISSPRRWQNNGFIRTVLLMWMIRFAYFAGVSPERLAQFYTGK